VCREILAVARERIIKFHENIFIFFVLYTRCSRRAEKCGRLERTPPSKEEDGEARNEELQKYPILSYRLIRRSDLPKAKKKKETDFSS